MDRVNLLGSLGALEPQGCNLCHFTFLLLAHSYHISSMKKLDEIFSMSSSETQLFFILRKYVL